MNPISDNLYDVALTAIRNCQWQGSEVEKVVRAVQELEQQHAYAINMREKHPMIAASLTPEQAKALTSAEPGKVLKLDVEKIEANIDAILEGKEPPHKETLVDAVSTKEVEPSKPTSLDVKAEESDDTE